MPQNSIHDVTYMYVEPSVLIVLVLAVKKTNVSCDMSSPYQSSPFNIIK